MKVIVNVKKFVETKDSLSGGFTMKVREIEAPADRIHFAEHGLEFRAGGGDVIGEPEAFYPWHAVQSVRWEPDEK